MREELEQLKLLVAELSLQNRRLKKTLNSLGENFPALARNSTRILASIKMLEINVSDLVELEV